MNPRRKEAVPPEREPFVSQEEVMRVLDISHRQLLRLLRDHDDAGRPQVPLPFHTLGPVEPGRYVQRKFLLSEVHAWRTRPKRVPEPEGMP